MPFRPASRMRRIALATLAAAATSLLGAAPAFAQAYPNKPVKFIVPFAPGSATDQLGRAFAAKVSEAIGQPVVVENKPGASAWPPRRRCTARCPTTRWATSSSSAWSTTCR